MKVSRYEVLAGMGYERDPFGGVLIRTNDQERIEKVVTVAMRSGGMLNVIGERGIGKTRTVNGVLKGNEVRIVRVQANDRDRITIADVETAIILDLSAETPKRTREVRARQLRRILGDASSRQSVAVILEEGHRLHHTTLRALKVLREMEWMGEPLRVAMVLIGQFDPMQEARVSEVRLRSDTVYLRGLSASEASEYIERTVGRSFEPEAADMASRSPAGRNFLDLQEYLIGLMARAMMTGLARVTTGLIGETESEQADTADRNEMLKAALSKRRAAANG